MKHKEPASVHLDFPKGCGVKVDGIDSVVVGKEVTITIVGVATSVRNDPSGPWNAGVGLSIRPTSCDIAGPAEQKSMDAAIRAAERRV